MTTHALHPDQLKPGDLVGPWLITGVLGSGGSSRVFKVERNGRPYSMKLALRPLSDSPEALGEAEYLDDKSAWRRLSREAAALFTYASHPNLLRVYGVDFWPSPHTGYPFLITDYVDGDTWHHWRWRKPPHAAGLVRTFSEVVRTVGVLHAHGVLHRDLKAENILIRRTDGRPFLIDFGTVRLPGTLTQTVGLPDGVLHLLPPEMLAYTRSEGWKHGQPFQGGVTADMYALGILLYQALTDLHPFDPKLSDEELVLAIATVAPAAPHVLNPLAPRSLSDIALMLLEKRPTDRFVNTAELLLALEDASNRERDSAAWKVPLFAAADDVEEPPPEPLPPPALAAQEEPSALVPSRPRWGRRLLLGALGLAGLGLCGWLVSSTLTPPLEREHSAKGSPPMSLAARSPSLLAAWLCAAAGWGCPAAQVKPPGPADCPKEAQEAMSRDLKLTPGSDFAILLDINQPRTPDGEPGVYKDGPVIGRIIRGADNLPEGTLLHGHFWTGPTVVDALSKEPAVMPRYTQAVLPDGRKYPVCITLGDPDARLILDRDFKPAEPGSYYLARYQAGSIVSHWE